MNEVLSEKDAARYWSYVRKTETCWLWESRGGSKETYGRFRAATSDDPTPRAHYVHRLAYEIGVGPIPEGKRIDHICHVTKCVNPAHLRVVTIKQNTENHAGPTSANRSGVRGVYWSRTAMKWTGQVTHNGKRYCISVYTDIREAEKAIVALRNRLFTHNDVDRHTQCVAITHNETGGAKRCGCRHEPQEHAA